MKNIKLHKWLADVDDNRELLSLNLLGTHDASANYVDNSFFSRCQDKTIYEQLQLGVRVLDLRVKRIDSTTLGMVHGISKARVDSSAFSRQQELSDVLIQCYNFLDVNSSEAIVIQFKNDDGSEQEQCFDLLFDEYIRKNPGKWFTENRSPRLSEVRGKIVLFRRCKKSDNPKYNSGNSGIDFSQWVEQDELTPEPLTLKASDRMEFVIQDRYKYKGDGKWDEVVKPFLDSMSEFDGRYIINYLSTAGGIKGPRHNADYVNSAFEEYELDKEKYYGVLYLDFPTEELARKIVKSNSL